MPSKRRNASEHGNPSPPFPSLTTPPTDRKAISKALLQALGIAQQDLANR
jgi:hypothetical protein